MRTGVGIDAQGDTAFPLDAQAARDAHDVSGAVRAALLTIGGILFWIPDVPYAPAFGIERKTLEYTLVRRDHAELPVPRHHRNPVSDEVHRRRGLRRLGRTLSGRLSVYYAGADQGRERGQHGRSHKA